MKKHLLRLCLLLLAMSCCLPAGAELSVDYVREDKGSSYVVRPLLRGLPNGFVEDSINRSITEAGNFVKYSAAISTLSGAESGGLQVDSLAHILEAGTGGGVLTVLVEAAGKIGLGRPGHIQTALMYHLSSGERIVARDIFYDASEAAREIWLRTETAMLSNAGGYLDTAAYAPVPLDNFLLEESGITFYYQPEQLTLLSGKSGSLHVLYHEVEDLLRMEEQALPNRLGILRSIGRNADSADKIASDVAKGQLPGIPLALGSSLDAGLKRFPKATDADAFPGGLRYQLEDDHFRGSQLIAAEGLVEGIVSRRMNLHGLIAGISSQEQMESVLGKASAVLPLEGQAAEQYGFPAGSLHEYPFEGNTLRFLVDPTGILQLVWLQRRPA